MSGNSTKGTRGQARSVGATVSLSADARLLTAIAASASSLATTVSAVLSGTTIPSSITTPAKSFGWTSSDGELG